MIFTGGLKASRVPIVQRADLSVQRVVVASVEIPEAEFLPADYLVVADLNLSNDTAKQGGAPYGYNVFLAYYLLASDLLDPARDSSGRVIGTLVLDTGGPNITPAIHHDRFHPTALYTPTNLSRRFFHLVAYAAAINVVPGDFLPIHKAQVQVRRF
jgi:hypothetical protein